MAEMVHLHVHTQYSLLDGAAPIEQLATAAQSMGMKAMAITDHGVMYGVLKFYQAMAKAGIKPILGCEVYVARRSRHDRVAKVDDDPFHLVLLAQNAAGYVNLMRLVSAAHLEGFYYRPRVDRELLAAHNEGLIALSACLSGEVASALLAGRNEAAQAAAAWYGEVFKDRFYLELQDQGLADQRKVNRGLLELAKSLGLPVVATNDVHYLKREDARIHDVLLCIQTGKTINDPDRMRFPTDAFYLRSAEEMRRVFADLPEALANTLAVAEQCDLRLELDRHILPEYKTPHGERPEEYLRELCLQALAEKYGENSAARERLEYELKVIGEMGFSGYFLVVWDLIRFARSRGIMVGPGRGSAAGSIVAYLLGITQLDPLRHGLLFERFLNPERVTMPDIDMDFCYERRGEVIAYIREKYGDDRVAQIVTFGTMAARAAVRDVGRVMGLPYGEVDRIAKLIPHELGITLDNALAASPELQRLVGEEPRIKNLWEIARAVEGFPRHASTHAAGVVIAPRPLTEYLPLTRSAEGEVATQLPMEDIEAIGLLKMDFLGLRTLTVIRDTLRLVKEETGEEVDLAQIPWRDALTAELLQKGYTAGVFQLESGGMRRLLMQLRPEGFEDLVPLVALYRPGPLGSGMVEDFIRSRHGERPVVYPHPMLEPILRETYGIILYQEQVMQICNRMGGFSLGEADLVRRAMGKKKPEVLASMRQKFVEGAVAQGVDPAKAMEIFDLMEFFAGYGFNKSHSAAYAWVVYQTAYLKAHYPREYMAALLTSVMGASDKITMYIEECRRMGLAILPPDVNYSYADFRPEGAGIRFGLLAVKNLGEGAIAAVLAERAKRGPFRSLYDFCTRLDTGLLNRRVIESMVRAGVFGSTGKTRRQMLEVLDEACDRMRRTGSGNRDQLSFFDLEELGFVPAGSGEQWPDLPEFPQATLLAMEKEYLGVYISGHPLDPWRERFRQNHVLPLAELEEETGDREVIVGGVVTGWRRMTTKAGKAMATFRLEDLTGAIEVLLFPKLYETVGELHNDEVVLVKGRLDVAEEARKLLASQVRVLEEKRGAAFHV
ncbi:MAG TPA: DNA polymerase III subunit alpha [Firmicutes bacterium]|nr:DNA polymerase III subunit alpha [Bacillota bacterium]